MNNYHTRTILISDPVPLEDAPPPGSVYIVQASETPHQVITENNLQYCLLKFMTSDVSQQAGNEVVHGNMQPYRNYSNIV